MQNRISRDMKCEEAVCFGGHSQSGGEGMLGALESEQAGRGGSLRRGPGTGLPSRGGETQRA